MSDQGLPLSLIRTRNYIDLNNESCNLERQVVSEIDEISSSPNEENIIHQSHEDYADERGHKKSQEYSKTQQLDNNIVQQPHIDDTIDILRELLSVERLRNKQRRDNYKTLQGYLNLLQTDYLRLAQELVDTLELSKKIKNEKDACIATLESRLRDSEHQIKKMSEVTSDLGNLRDNFNELLEKKVAAERELYEKQKQMLEQQIIHERVNNSQLLQQFQDRLEEQEKSHKLKMELFESRLKDAEQERDSLLSEPQNDVIRLLREEKGKLMSRVDELEYANQEASSKYETLKKKSDSLITEVERLEQHSQEEVNRIQEAHQDLSLAYQEVLLELEGENEIIQVLQNNLKQSERRAINLLSTLKDKETTWESLLKQTEMKHEEMLDKLKVQVRSMNRKIDELEIQLEQKQNDIVRCQLEQETRLDSIRSDRDQRLNRLQLEKSRIEQTQLTTDTKLTSEIDRNILLTEENSKLSRELSQLREENEKLSLDLMRVEAVSESRLQELSSKFDATKSSLNQDSDKQHSTLELEEVQRANGRLERCIKELKKDNQKLLLKLKVNESSLLNITNAIKKEQTKLILDHEKKLESIKQQQMNYDKSRSKYKRYGFKLKKYCEHLSLVHRHVCNPFECGYQMVCNQDSKFCIKKT